MDVREVKLHLPKEQDLTEQLHGIDDCRIGWDQKRMGTGGRGGDGNAKAARARVAARDRAKRRGKKS